jgi:hypothetical protein
MEIRGTGIPTNTYIVTRNSATSVTISQAATATATGVTLTVCRPKIITLGLGLLEIEGITFLDGGTTGNSPLLQTTNTTLRVYDNAFIGRAAATTVSTTITSAPQDAIILGGTRSLLFDSSHNSAFQGYGTVIRSNFFNKIRRQVYFRTYCNGNVVRDNISWTGCGADSTAAAIDILGGSVESDTGNVVVGNLIEMNNYAYGIKLATTAGNTIGPNNFYDEGAGVLAHHRLESTALFNRITAGTHSDLKTFVSEATARQNDIVNYHQGALSRLLQKHEFSGVSAGDVKLKSTASTAYGVTRENSSGDAWLDYAVYNSGTGFASQTLRFTINGGSDEDLFTFQRAAANQSRFRLLGTTDNRIEADADLRVYSKTASSLFLGDASNNASITNGILTASKGFTAGRQVLTYSTTIGFNPASGAMGVITVTNGTAFTISAPLSGTNGQIITFHITNSSGGAMGAITWSSAAGGYRLAGAFTNPANGTMRTIAFQYDATLGKWVEIARAAADIS